MPTVVIDQGDHIEISVFESGVIFQGKNLVGDVEILSKGDGNEELTVIEDNDVVQFFDSVNGDRRVIGIVKNAAVSVKTFDAGTGKYTNLRAYDNTLPGT